MRKEAVYYRKTDIKKFEDFKDGDIICEVCNGWGYFYDCFDNKVSPCYHCKGIGKLDWITNVTGFAGSGTSGFAGTSGTSGDMGCYGQIIYPPPPPPPKKRVVKESLFKESLFNKSLIRYLHINSQKLKQFLTKQLRKHHGKKKL